MELHETVREFLEKETPAGGTPYDLQWKSKCEALGADAIPIFLTTLHYGDEERQYRALLALRVLGYEIYGDDHLPKGFGYRYRISIKAPWQVIYPATPRIDTATLMGWRKLPE